MAVEKMTDASSIGEGIADLLRDEQTATRLWTGNDRGSIEFWLLTKPISVETERHLYGVSVGLHERFPKTLIGFHLINPRYFDDLDVTEIVPLDAQEIRLR